MSDPAPPRDDTASASRQVESQLEGLGDPEGSPGNPTGTLAAGAAPEQPATWRTGTGTRREILTLAWPVMMSMMLASIIGLTDIAMVGRLGAEAQAAVGYAQQLFFVAQSALFALSFGCVALMARAIGAGEPAEARRDFAASVVLSLGIAALLFVALGSAPAPLLRALGAVPEVVRMSVPYIRLIMASTLLMSVCLIVESGMRSDKDTVTPMIVTLVLTVVKVGLNGVFIFGWLGGPQLGVTGAGVATLIAQAVAFVIFVGLVLRRPGDVATRLRPADFRGIRSRFRPLLQIALPSIGERLVMNAAMIAYFGFIGTYGTVAAATYTIGIRILSFSWIPGTGYSQAVATLVGQSLGRGDEVAAERAGWRGAGLALGTAAVMGLLGALAREPLARLFTVDEATVLALGPFMLCLSLAQPAMQLHFTLAGAFRGAGDTSTPLGAAFVGNWLFRVPLGMAAALWLELPLVWLWMALIFDHVARALWLTVAYRRGTWKRRLAKADARR